MQRENRRQKISHSKKNAASSAKRFGAGTEN